MTTAPAPETDVGRIGIRYLVNGSLVFGLNFAIAAVASFLLPANATVLERNLANLLATEVALLASFFIHAQLTWKHGLGNFFPKLFKFHLVALFGVGLRVVAFYVLDRLGMHFLVATVISIVSAVLINFFGYHLFVFVSNRRVAGAQGGNLAYQESGAGTKTLEVVEEARNYNNYVADFVRPYLGAKNLEIGAGLGTISNLIEDHPLALYDISPSNVAALKKRFADRKNVVRIGSDYFGCNEPDSFDCIYSTNVLEHVEDDSAMIAHAARLLKVGGHFVAFVPAGMWLYSPFDASIGHFRRYTRADLRRIRGLIAEAGLPLLVKEYRFVNPIGALGWFVKMRLLRTTAPKPEDALLIDAIIGLLRYLDLLRLPFGQSVVMVLERQG